MKKATLLIGLCVLTQMALAQHAEDDVSYLYMDSLFQHLPEVMVRGERPVVKAERGRLVYDLPRMMEQLPVSNVYEAIQKLPGIIEQNGSLTLGGRGVTLLINGKVSSLSADELRSMLESTPVSRLEKAEVMYAAPARYHIRGAMVNVVLKSGLGQQTHWSGEVMGNYTQSRRGDGSTRGSLLYTSDRLSMDAMYAYGFLRTASGIDKHSWHTLNNEVHELDLQTQLRGYGGRHNVRLGMDYDLGRKNFVNVLYNGQFRYGQDRTTMRGTANSDKQDDGSRQLHNIKVDYQAPFGFSAGADFLFAESPSQTHLHKDLQSTSQYLYQESNQRINRWLLYLSQVHNLSNGTELNYGVKYSTTHDNSFQLYKDGDTGEAMADASQRLLRKEYTLNSYVGASHSFGKHLSGEVSLAAELYHAKERHSWMLYPTLNLTYTPADGHTFQFSFTSNREYPNYWQLQPIVQYVDSYIEAHGNPELKPSSDYAFDLNYLYRNKYMLGVNYDYNPDYFVQLPYQLPDRLAEVNQVVNYDYQKRITLRAMVPYKVGSWWSGRLFAFGLFSHDKHSSFHDAPFDRHKAALILNTMNTFILSKRHNIIGTIGGFYQSPCIQGIYNLRAVGNLNASLQWMSANKRMQIILQGNDLLQTSRMTMHVDWDEQRSRTQMKWDNRNVSLTLLYKFGGYKEKKREEVDTKRLGKN